MSKPLAFIIPLAIGLVAGIALTVMLQQLVPYPGGNSEIAQLERRFIELDDELTTSIKRQAELAAQLKEAQKDSALRKLQMESDIVGLQSQLSQEHNQSAGSSGAGPATAVNPDDEPVVNPKDEAFAKFWSVEDIKRYARAMLQLAKARAGGGTGQEFGRLDEASQKAIREFTTYAMALELKYGIDNRRGDALAMYRVPELRQLLSEVAVAMCEESGQPMSDQQKQSFAEWLRQNGAGADEIENRNASSLEKYIARTKFTAQQETILKGILSPQQQEAMPVSQQFGGGNQDMMPRGGPRYDDKTRGTAVDNIVKNWSRELALNDAEKQSVTPIASRYIDEYLILRRTAESQYGKEFMDNYLQRDPPEGANRRDYFQQRQDYIAKHPDYTQKSSELNLKFLELQLKYQNETKSYLPQKTEQINKQSARVTHFPKVE